MENKIITRAQAVDTFFLNEEILLSMMQNMFLWRNKKFILSRTAQYGRCYMNNEIR